MHCMKTRISLERCFCTPSGTAPPTLPPDPCEKVKCREKEECTKGVCVHISKATCRAVGDPHYLTFDGERFDFQGTCSYVMATVVKSEPGLIPFTVLTKNNHRGNKRVSFVRKVSVTVYGLTVVMSTHKGKVEVSNKRPEGNVQSWGRFHGKFGQSRR